MVAARQSLAFIEPPESPAELFGQRGKKKTEQTDDDRMSERSRKEDTSGTLTPEARGRCYVVLFVAESYFRSRP